MDDVLIVGAGPAGSVAATVLARAGARVRLIDRAAFPREKLCGDTVNPGTLALLQRLGLAGSIERRGLRVDGMLVTGDGGISVTARYPRGLSGRAIARSELDCALVECAVEAGATLDTGVTARGGLVTTTSRGEQVVDGVEAGSSLSRRSFRARITIAADGRRSALAFGLRLARHPARPRRWAIGAYFEHDTRASTLGEMHIRLGRYIGVAPVRDGLVNVCLVKPAVGGDCEFGDPERLLRREIASEPLLRDRLADARIVRPPLMLGPLAIDVTRPGIDGLILAGDAAGFIDPMTGDGLRFAVGGGELAAAAALRALEHGWRGVHAWLEAERRRVFAGKWRLNRALRALVASPASIRAAGIGARLAPVVIRQLVARAGDCGLAAD